MALEFVTGEKEKTFRSRFSLSSISSPAMKQVQASSGVPPEKASSGVGLVHNNVTFIDPKTTRKLQTNIIKNNNKKTIAVEVPLKLAKPKMRERKLEDRHCRGTFHGCVSSQMMVQNLLNFKNSQAPLKKLMQRSGGVWVSLSDEVLTHVNSAFIEKQPMVEIKVDGNNYIFDFLRMLQIDIGNGLQRSIAWIDVDENCYFPKFFVDGSLLDDDDDDDDDVDNNDEKENDDEGVDSYNGYENPKVEIRLKINVNNNTIDIDNDKDNLSATGKEKRKVRVYHEDDDTADSTSCNNGETDNVKRQHLIPKGVDVIASPMKLKWPNARLLVAEDGPFSIVRDKFMSGMKKKIPGVQITSIHQFNYSGPMEKARWEAFHKHMKETEAARGHSNTVLAWHGASKEGVDEILTHGFRLPSKVFGPQATGIGVYLSHARLPHLSDVLSESDDDGEKHVILCSVILGNIEKVEVGSQQSQPSSLRFDCGVDDLIYPNWYVVWTKNMNMNIVPLCIVSYKCFDGQQEILNGIPKGLRSLMTTMIFSKLESSLSASKVGEFKALYMTFQAGKMTKALFLKQLESIVGTELLRASISEVQCSMLRF